MPILNPKPESNFFGQKIITEFFDDMQTSLENLCCIESANQNPRILSNTSGRNHPKQNLEQPPKHQIPTNENNERRTIDEFFAYNPGNPTPLDEKTMPQKFFLSAVNSKNSPPSTPVMSQTVTYTSQQINRSPNQDTINDNAEFKNEFSNNNFTSQPDPTEISSHPRPVTLLDNSAFNPINRISLREKQR